MRNEKRCQLQETAFDSEVLKPDVDHTSRTGLRYNLFYVRERLFQFEVQLEFGKITRRASILAIRRNSFIVENIEKVRTGLQLRREVLLSEKRVQQQLAAKCVDKTVVQKRVTQFETKRQRGAGRRPARGELSENS